MQRLFYSLIFLNSFIYCSYVYAYIFNAEVAPIKPLYWYLLTVGTVLLLALSRYTKITVHKSQYLYIIWIWVYLCYTLFNFFYSSQDESATNYLVSRIEMIALFCAFFYFLQLEKGVYVTQLSVLSVTVLGVFLNYYDFFSQSLSKVPGRAAGFYINPSVSGEILVLSMVVSIPLVTKRFRLLYCLFVGLGVIVTFGRASWITWAVAVTCLSAIGCFSIKNKALAISLLGFFSLFFVYSLLTGGFLDYLNTTSLSNYLTTNTLGRLGGEGGAFVDDSTYSRLQAALLAWSAFQEHPWLGFGLAYTSEWNYIVPPHNAYLLFAAQGGTLGLIVFLFVFFAIWVATNNIGKIFVIVLAITSLFSHTMLDQPPIIVMISLLVYLGIDSEKTQKKIIGV